MNYDLNEPKVNITKGLKLLFVALSWQTSADRDLAALCLNP